MRSVPARIIISGIQPWPVLKRPIVAGFEAPRDTFIVRVPPPRIDRDMVCVDPSAIQVIKEIGWCRLAAYSGRECEAGAKRELQAQILEAGSGSLLREKAVAEGREALLRLLAPVSAAFDAEPQVEFVPDEGEHWPATPPVSRIETGGVKRARRPASTAILLAIEEEAAL